MDQGTTAAVVTVEVSEVQAVQRRLDSSAPSATCVRSAVAVMHLGLAIRTLTIQDPPAITVVTLNVAGVAPIVHAPLLERRTITMAAPKNLGRVWVMKVVYHQMTMRGVCLREQVLNV